MLGGCGDTHNFSGCLPLLRHHGNPGSRPRSRLVPDHDLHVLVEGREEGHQAFHREPVQLVVGERRRLRLIDPQSFGGGCLRKLPVANDAVDGMGEP